MTTRASVGAEPASIPLDISHGCPVDLERARRALSDLSWLGRPAEDEDGRPAEGRYVTDLDLPVLDGGGRGTVRKAASVDIGPLRGGEDTLIVPVSWRSTTFAPLFPVFAGQLVVTSKGLALRGRYAPPFGRLGLVIDAALLHVIARRTGQAFLTRIAAHVVGSRRDA